MGAAMGVVKGAISAVNTGVQYSQIGPHYAALIAEDQENKRQAEQSADDALARGQKEEQLYRIKASQAVERQRTAYANSGVDTTTGTPADVMADTRMLSELDAQTLKNNAAREAMGYRNQAKKAERQQKQHAREMQEKQTATIIGGLADFAGSVGGSGGGEGISFG